MSYYTTGEIAKLCGVTVRTVQYYDTRELLSPSELTEGGRRLYAEEDVKRLRVICFLRELGLSIPVISQLLKEDDPGSVIDLLLSQQAQILREEIDQKQRQLDQLTTLQQGLKDAHDFSFESIQDVALNMENRKKLNRLYIKLVVIGLAMEALELIAIILWAVKGLWWPFAVWTAFLIPFCVVFSRMYFNKVAYICPQCHETFRPNKREAFFANHTLRTRKLTCSCCGHKGFCVETWAGDDK
ncbi:MAG: MerR family transcriptional regulator [Clostridiales bacterium]|nr:MerR family transcriptional regulator [Clostridiales bacterium]